MNIRTIKPMIIRAIDDELQLNFKYWGEEGSRNRTVDPWYLLKRNENYYIFGFCHLEKEIRCFHLKRIQDYKPPQRNTQVKAIPLSKIFSFKKNSIPNFYDEPERFIAYAYPEKYEENIKKMSVQLYKNLQKEIKLANTKVSKFEGYPLTIQLSKMNIPSKCRSPLEYKVLCDLNENPEVKVIEVETVKIQYFHKRISNIYKPDILITYSDGTRDLIEVKLAGDIGAPKNQAKFVAAQEFAKNNNMQFYIIGTEGNSKSHNDRSDWSDLDTIETKIFSPSDVSNYKPLKLKATKKTKKKSVTSNESTEVVYKTDDSIQESNYTPRKKRRRIPLKSKKFKNRIRKHLRTILLRRYRIITK